MKLQHLRKFVEVVKVNEEEEHEEEEEEEEECVAAEEIGIS